METMINREKIICFVEQFYNHPGRYFHNFKHILSAEKYFNEMSDEQYVAWLFHDIIYIPGNNDNEEESEKFFQEYILWNDLNVDYNIVSKIILDTKLHKATIPESNFVLDIDMLCMSLPYEEFVFSREEVVKEYAPVFGEKETREGVKNFMIELIGKNIYTTDKFLSKNELAQNNIKRYIS